MSTSSAPDPAPALAIVVATRNRPAGLRRLLDALASQTIGAGACEVVIVDDASEGSHADEIRAAVREIDFAVLVRNDERRGPAASRNRGWRAATADLVAFTDDDCAPEPGWAAALVDGLRHVEIAQGRTIPDPGQLAQRGPFSHTIEVRRFSHRFETCNIAYRRDVLDAVGGFDEGFPDAYGEDVDLGWRATEAGARSRFVPDAVVRHDIGASSFAGALRRSRRVGAMAGVVGAHPGYRRYLHARVFTDRSHGWALLALAGATTSVAIRRRWPLTAVAPYVGHRLGRGALWPRRAAVCVLPGALVLDIVEAAVLVRGSVRSRTFVL